MSKYRHKLQIWRNLICNEKLSRQVSNILNVKTLNLITINIEMTTF